MNINNISSETSYLQSQQYSYKKTSVSKVTSEVKEQPQSAKQVEITASVLSVEKTTGYDLENITPKETYMLAQELYNAGEISIIEHGHMYFIGFTHEHNTNMEENNLNHNNAPFNLLTEVDAIASGTYKKSFNFNYQKEAQDLYNTLLSLPSKKETISALSINIKA